MQKVIKLVAGVLFLSSCQTNEFSAVELQPEGKLPIQISHLSSIQTRVEENQFNNNDAIGLFSYVQSTSFPENCYVDNMRFVLNDENWAPDEPVYYPENQVQSNFVAYYPYQPHLLSSDHCTTTVSVETNQASDENIKFSDFKVAHKEGILPTKSAVNLSFEHEMALVKVVLSPGKGFKDAQELLNLHPKITFKSVATQATYNFETLSLTQPTTKADIHPWGSFELVDDKLIGVEAILVPQTLARKQLFIEVKTDERVYGLAFDDSKTLTKRTNITCHLTLERQKYEGGISTTIEDWDQGEIIIGTAEEHYCREVRLQQFSKLGTKMALVKKENKNIALLAHESITTKDHAYRMEVCYALHQGKVDFHEGFIFVVYTCDDVSMTKEEIHGGRLLYDEKNQSYTVELGNCPASTSLYLDALGNASYTTVEHIPLLAPIYPKRITDVEGHELGMLKIGTKCWTLSDYASEKEAVLPKGWSYPTAKDIEALKKLYSTPEEIRGLLHVEGEVYWQLTEEKVAHFTTNKIEIEPQKGQNVMIRCVQPISLE
jgi:hypothetical protein